MAQGLLPETFVEKNKLIGVTQLKAGGRVIPVELFRNECGTVAARCHLGRDMPIIDGPSVDEVLKSIEDSLEGLLLARASRAA